MDLGSKIQKIKKFESGIRKNASTHYELGLINGVEYCLSVLEETKLNVTKPYIPPLPEILKDNRDTA